MRGFPLAHLGRGPRSPSAHSSEFLAFPRIIPSCRRVRKFSRFFSPPLDVYPCKRAICRLLSGFPVLLEAHCALSVPFPGPSESLVGPLQPVCRQVFPFFFTAAPFLSPPFYFFLIVCLASHDQIKLTSAEEAPESERVRALAQEFYQEPCSRKNQSDQKSKRPH